MIRSDAHWPLIVEFDEGKYPESCLKVEEVEKV